MIQYKYGTTKDPDITVVLEGKHVGDIRKVEEGWQYFPKGHSKGGAVYGTVQQVKESLEEE